MSGISCAANLCNEGYNVIILEKSQTFGGCLHSYTYQKYNFDSGLHFIGNMIPRKDDYIFLRHNMDEDCEYSELKGGESKEAFDVIDINGRIYEIPGGVENYKNALYKYFPDEKEAIDEYIKEILNAETLHKYHFMINALPKYYYFKYIDFYQKYYFNYFLLQ